MYCCDGFARPHASHAIFCRRRISITPIIRQSQFCVIVALFTEPHPTAVVRSVRVSHRWSRGSVLSKIQFKASLGWLAHPRNLVCQSARCAQDLIMVGCVIPVTILATSTRNRQGSVPLSTRGVARFRKTSDKFDFVLAKALNSHGESILDSNIGILREGREGIFSCF